MEPNADEIAAQANPIGIMGKKLPKKVITVPKDIDRQVASDALNAMSVKIDKLTKEQKKYADSW